MLLLKVRALECDTLNKKPSERIKLWDRHLPELFVDNIDIVKMSEVEEQLNLLTENNSVHNSDINSIATKLGNIFVNSAELSYGKIISNNYHVQNNKVDNKKSWFGRNCATARREFHRAKHQYNATKSAENKLNLKDKGAKYKKILHINRRRYIQSKANTLQDLKNSDPKMFWKTITNRKRSKTNISTESFYNYMKNINQDNGQYNNDSVSYDNQELPEFDFINDPITVDEIRSNVQKLSNGKSNGLDQILNEHIKSTLHILMPVYYKLFNLVFDSGIIPESWTLGSIIPIYKNKGAQSDPENYRPITLVSCLGKLFTSIINSRLQSFAREFELLSESQTGFRKTYSTCDSIFALHMLISILFNQKKKLFCAFIDFKRAFDTVWRDGLWVKILAHKIRGKCFNIIYNLYQNIILVGWLFWVLRPFETVFQSISGRLPKRGRKRRERIDESKNVQTTPTRTYCKCSRPLPYCNPNCRTPQHWKFTQHHRSTRPPPQNIKSCVFVNGETSAFFDCTIGVRQGDNLSPFLFSLYLNDLEDFLRSQNVNGITCDTKPTNDIDRAVMFFKLFVFLYADDTALVAESAKDLQYALNTFKIYCTTWKLTVNISKTKVIVFGKGRMPKNIAFSYDEIPLEVVNNYKYLGIYFTRTGSFHVTIKHIYEQANKALTTLLRNIHDLQLNIDLQINLFDKMIKPILLYACEIWGFSNCKLLEKVQLRFLKSIFNLKSSTPNIFVYGEYGVYPIEIDIQARMVSFWTKLVSENESNKVSSILYQFMYAEYRTEASAWLNCVKNILIKCGFSGFWDKQRVDNPVWLVKSAKQKLKDLFINEWFLNISNSSTSLNYRLFKEKFELEYYMLKLPYTMKRDLCHFRTRNHRLSIETGKWIGLEISERKCSFCMQEVGDEFHVLLRCPTFNVHRKRYIKPYFTVNPNIIKFNELMNSKNIKQLKNLCKFIKIILQSATSS